VSPAGWRKGIFNTVLPPPSRHQCGGSTPPVPGGDNRIPAGFHIHTRLYECISITSFDACQLSNRFYFVQLLSTFVPPMAGLRRTLGHGMLSFLCQFSDNAHFINFFPRKFQIASAKVAVGRGLFVDWAL